jgi:hypothetical protein
MATMDRTNAGAASCTGTGATSTATLNNRWGKLTTAALTTAAAGTHVITLTDTAIAATDVVVGSVSYGTATTGDPTVSFLPAAGTMTITINNRHASAAVNGTLVVSYGSFPV